MSHIFHRNSLREPPRAVRGEGIYVIDDTGKRYLDASGGAAVSCLGHDHPQVISAIKAQLDQLPYAHTGFFTSEPAEQLADELIALAPGDLDRVYIVSGGSEAIEAALKLARQYFIERGEPQRSKFIARRQSYHGNTLGALAVGGNQWRREPFEPLLMAAEHIAPCYAYRDQAPDESDAAYASRLAGELEQTIQRMGPETVIGFVAETVGGATAGVLPPTPGYFKAIREVCDRYGVLLILDEVMCGMGRTGSTFACTQEDIAPDIATIAKGLGAGYQPIGAMLCTAHIHDTIARGTGFFQHGHTYMGHAAACAGALAVQRVIREHDLLANVQAMGAALERALIGRLGNHPHVGDIRGRGLFWGIELVADRANQTPFDPTHKLHAQVKARAFDAGLMCYPMGGTVDGRRGDHILLAPPFMVSAEEIDTIADEMGNAIESALSAIPTAAGD
jgi:adenosylmethionine-8-amino-7-oxononanoate aminotransferase